MKKITVVETSPRDGWEHQPFVIPTETKLKYIKAMIQYGARKLDLVNFADPDKVPQMADSAEVLQEIMHYAKEQDLPVECMALAFDVPGIRRALAAGATSIQYAFSVSDKTNEMLGTTLEQSKKNLLTVLDAAGDAKVTLGLLCALGTPFEEDLPLARLKEVCQFALDAGVHKITLPDTAGLASPAHTKKVLRAMKEDFDLSRFGLHVHNAYGMGLANCFAAVEEGITCLDGALGGLGAGPFVFIPANHNLATEDLVNLLESCGYDTGYNLKDMIHTAREMCAETGAVPDSALINKENCLLCRPEVAEA